MNTTGEWFEKMRGQDYDDFIEEVGLDLENQFNDLIKEENGEENGMV